MKFKLPAQQSPRPDQDRKESPVQKETVQGLGRVNLQTLPLSSLQKADYNPRTISEKARAGLAASISTFGLVEPIIWNKRTGNIVGGHQRYDQLVEAGVVETDVVVVDLDDGHEKALNITLNNRHIAGDWTQQVTDLLSEISELVGLESFMGLQLGELEKNLLKEFNIKAADVEFSGSEDGELPLKERAQDTKRAEDFDPSHVKQVQLFLTIETHPLFMELVGELRKKFMTDNPTDTVMEALKYCVEN